MFLKRKEPVKDNVPEKVGDIFTVNLLVETDNGGSVKDISNLFRYIIFNWLFSF
jgi:hypothetical protein